MELMLAHAWAAARRGDPLAVVVLDLDGFKEVNDTLGHHAGDELLCAVGEALRDEARESDVVVRFGGDEFLALLTGGTAEGGHLLVERLRKRLGTRVGISAGVAAYTPEMATAEEMIRLADRRLYDGRASRRPAH
jgi:diguanylate cyclase (GGDEF)-like protein